MFTDCIIKHKMHSVVATHACFFKARTRIVSTVHKWYCPRCSQKTDILSMRCKGLGGKADKFIWHICCNTAKCCTTVTRSIITQVHNWHGRTHDDTATDLKETHAFAYNINRHFFCNMFYWWRLSASAHVYTCISCSARAFICLRETTTGNAVKSASNCFCQKCGTTQSKWSSWTRASFDVLQKLAISLCFTRGNTSSLSLVWIYCALHYL